MNLLVSLEKAIFNTAFPYAKKEPVRLLQPTLSSVQYRVHPVEYRTERIYRVEIPNVATLSIPKLNRSSYEMVRL